MTRPKRRPLSRLSLRSTDRDVRALWAETEGGPAYPVREVREFQVRHELREKGLLRPMVGIPRRADSK